MRPHPPKSGAPYVRTTPLFPIFCSKILKTEILAAPELPWNEYFANQGEGVGGSNQAPDHFGDAFVSTSINRCPDGVVFTASSRTMLVAVTGRP